MKNKDESFGKEIAAQNAERLLRHVPIGYCVNKKKYLVPFLVIAD